VTAQTSTARKETKRRPRRTANEIRASLFKAAVEEFKAKGYAGATTAAIAKRADVAEIQMFRYFPSKADLFLEAIFTPVREHFRAFNAAHMAHAVDAASIKERSELYVHQLQAFLKDHAKMILALFVAQTYPGAAFEGSAGIKHGLQAFFEECATVMVRRAGQGSDIDPTTIVRIAFGALLGCITYQDWLFPTATPDPPSIDRAISEFILAGIAPHSDLGKTARV
jgi:AcrR family transcriptional regulator